MKDDFLGMSAIYNSFFFFLQCNKNRWIHPAVASVPPPSSTDNRDQKDCGLIVPFQLLFIQ